jgi:hypothetical protein
MTAIRRTRRGIWPPGKSDAGRLKSDLCLMRFFPFSSR